MSEYIYGTDGHEGHWLTDEEIIRCRDCAFWASVENQYAAGESKPAAVVMGCTRHGEPSKPEDFCSWALRRQHG